MKRKFINALLVCGLIVTTAFSLSSCKDYDDDIDSLQEQINSLSSLTDSEVSTVESSIASLQTTASNLSSEISSVESSLEAAIAEKADADDVDALEIELASLEASLSSVESAIAALEAALEDYAKTSDVLEQIAILESGIAEAKAEAEAAQSAADAAQSAADAANSTLTTVISELATVYSDLQDQLTLLEESILSTVAETYATQASLESEITTVTSLIETLQNRIAELENSTETADALEEAKQELEAEIDSLKARVETLEGYKETLDNLDTTVANAVAEAENYADEAVADLKDYTDSEIGNIYDYINNNFTTTDGLAEINEAIADYYETKAELLESNEEILASLNTINEQIDAINTSIGKMYGILGKQLKSLVFNPELYWGGIEAIEVAYYSYEALDQKVVTGDGDESSDAPYSFDTSIYVNVAPLVYASYYANPSNADIDTKDLTKWSFIGNTATYVSRAVTTADGDIDIKGVENTNGVIDVTFKVQASGLEELLDNGDDEVDVVALQYTQPITETEGDTVITSDFAALYIDEITEFYINAVTTAGAVDTETPTTADQHLATTAKLAIDDYTSETGAYPVLYVNYDSSINLEDWINVHKGNDELWGGKATLAESDFYMTYELVGWLDGDNETSESVHAGLSDMDEDGISNETLTPQPAVDGAALITAAGRAPLVRVTLWDINDSDNPHIVTVGYIIVKITEEEVEDEQKIEDQTIILDDEYEIACGSDEITVTTKWSEIEVKLYTLVGLSKTNFEAIYELDGMTENGYATQYNSSKVALDAADYIGTVTITTSDDASQQTNVLQWAVSNEEAYEAFVTNGQTQIVTYVKLASSKKAYPDIYVALTWAPSNAPISSLDVNVVTTSTVKDSYWYAEDSTNEGLAEVHWKIGMPTTADDPEGNYDNIVVDKTFLTTPLATVTDAVDNEGYTALTSASEFAVTYYFAATKYQDAYGTAYEVADGTKYYIQTASDGLSIGVNTASDLSGTYYELATIEDEETGEIALTTDADGIEIFEAIINSRTKDDLANYLTYTLAMNVVTCDPAGSEFITISNLIDVVVITPLFVTEAETSEMEWDNGLSLADKTVSIEITDYDNRNYAEFYAVSVSGASDMINFYQIESIELDTENATTNFSTKSSTGDFIAVDTNDFELTYTAASSVTAETDDSGNYTGNLIGGTITLKQNSNVTSGQFTIEVPLVVTYAWGTIESTYTIYVQASASKATAKRR